MNTDKKMDKRFKVAIGILAGVLAGIVVLKFLCGLSLIAVSSWYLSTSQSLKTHYFKTVSELLDQRDQLIGTPQRISGGVLGESIRFDPTQCVLTFTIVEVPADFKEVERQGGLAAVLQNAVNNPDQPKIQVVYFGEKPELLRHMTQAIIVGHLEFDGMFYADEILLRCPSRYEGALPDQVGK